LSDSNARFHITISDDRNAALKGIINFANIEIALSGAPGASKSSINALFATKE